MAAQSVRFSNFSIILIIKSLLLSIVSAEMEFRYMDHRDHMDQLEQMRHMRNLLPETWGKLGRYALMGQMEQLPENDQNEKIEQMRKKQTRQTNQMLSQSVAEVSPYFETLCNHLSRGLYYSPDLLLNTEWTSVYAWNKESGYMCTQAEFELPTEEKVRSYFETLQYHVTPQPEWEAAALVLTMRIHNKSTESLLFTDRFGPPGSFHMVPKYINRIVVLLQSKGIEHFPLINVNMQILQTSDQNCQHQNFLYILFCKMGAMLYTQVDAERRCPTSVLVNKVIQNTVLPDGRFICPNYLHVPPLIKPQNPHIDNPQFH